MTTKPVLAAIFVGIACMFSADALQAQSPSVSLPAEEVARIMAKEFSHSLAVLKIQEVALQKATPADDKALALNRAQQDAIERELVNLTVGPLEKEWQRLSMDLRPKHPKMVALSAEIEKAKANFAGSH